MDLVPRQGLSIFDVAPHNEHAFLIDDALNVVPGQKFTDLEVRLVYTDGNLGGGANVTTKCQKIKIFGGAWSKQSAIIPPPKINTFRTAVIYPSRCDEPAFLPLNFYRFLWAVEAQSKFRPQLANGERGLFLHLAQLPLQSCGSTPRFHPSGECKNAQSKSEGSYEVVRKIFWVFNGGSNPTTEFLEWRGILILIAAACCCVLGLGFLGSGTHTAGIVLLVIGLFGLCLPYLLGSLDRRSENVGVEPIVVSELKLRDVQRHIFGAHFVEGANHTALEDRPKTFDGLSVDRADNVLAFGVIDYAMWELFTEFFISGPLVSAEQTNLVRDGFADEGYKRIGADVFNDASHNVALAADCANDSSLAGADATRSAATAALIPMAVLGFAADESLVDLDDAAKLPDVLHEGDSNLVTHEPRGLVRTEAHVAADLQGAHALLAGEHEVSDLKPIPQGFVRVFEDRARKVREAIGRVLGTLVALPMPRIALQRSRLRSATARAMHPLGPSFPDQIGAAGFLIRERLIELRRSQLVDVFYGRHGSVPHYGRNIAWPI
jgi:hypothetical protein